MVGKRKYQNAKNIHMFSILDDNNVMGKRLVILISHFIWSHAYAIAFTTGHVLYINLTSVIACNRLVIAFSSF